MKRALYVLLIFLMPSIGKSQEQYIIQVKDGKLWGYIDINGKALIQPRYKKCEEFSESGLAPVFIEAAKKWMFIRPNGSVLTSMESDLEFKTAFGYNVEGFHDGMLAVSRNKKWGFVNTDGELVIPPKYDRVSRFNDGLGWGEERGTFFILDKSGNETPIQLKGVDELRNFSEGLIPFRLEGGMFGYLNESGEVVIEAQFRTVGYFVDDVAWARGTNDKLGFINKEGKWIIDPQFDFAVDFDPVSGMARVKEGDNWFYVDKDDKRLNMTDSELWEDFKEGLAIGRKGRVYGFFNSAGEWVIEPQFDGARGFKNGYAAVKKDKKWGIIDKQGNWAVNPEYDAMKDVEFVK